MIIYSLRIKIELTAEEDWLEWMKDVFIPELVTSGYFNDAVIYKELNENTSSNLASYEVHCRADELEDFISFSEIGAASMQKILSERFGGRYIAERVLLVEI